MMGAFNFIVGAFCMLFIFAILVMFFIGIPYLLFSSLRK